MSDEKTEFTINVKVNGLEDVERLSGRIRELIAASERAEAAEPESPHFSIGDVVSLKSGGPRMTVSRIETYPGNPDKCALIGCVWFSRLNDDADAATRYPYDGTRYTGDSYEGDFPADCLEP